MDTLKPADDGSGDLVIRLYESKKADTTYHVVSQLPIESLVPCNLLEQEIGEPLNPQQALHIHPFGVRTYKLKLAKKAR